MFSPLCSPVVEHIESRGLGLSKDDTMYPCFQLPIRYTHNVCKPEWSLRLVDAPVHVVIASSSSSNSNSTRQAHCCFLLFFSLLDKLLAVTLVSSSNSTDLPCPCLLFRLQRLSDKLFCTIGPDSASGSEGCWLGWCCFLLSFSVRYMSYAVSDCNPTTT